MYEPDGGTAEADNPSSELVAGRRLLRRCHIHTHVIVREIQSRILGWMSVAKCSTDRLRRSCSLTLLCLRSPGFQVPHVQRLLRSFRWIGVPYLQFEFVLRFRHLRVWVVMGQVVWVLLHAVLEIDGRSFKIKESRLAPVFFFNQI